MNAETCLRIGDDALIAAQRLAQWSARAPDMEEDVALSNIALDQLGVARLALGEVGAEDELAYLRGPAEFRNCLLVEQPDAGDFARLIAKLLFLSAFQFHRYDELSRGEDEFLAGLGAKAYKESTYHLDHAALWTVRLGDGTEESHHRIERAVADLWPFTVELFEDAPTVHAPWHATVDAVLAEATLHRPDVSSGPTGGRSGRHTPYLAELLDEMQSLHRAHPGARW